jgi:CDP-paratose 2-epimerase
VAVTTSVANPRDDFDINALGTFNMLEAVRHFCPHAPFIYASTNKVYGLLPHIEVVEGARRYEIKGKKGVSESEPLDFHSPYGCSKGSADQYVVDYARIYGLKTVSFRQSCIYGERQFGVEDQGWMAWFIIAGILGRSVSIYGDGKQVRDVLYVHDLVKLYEKSMEQRNALSGKAYNVGGGLENSLSLLEFIEILKDQDLQLSFTFGDWRPGDQRVFISDNTKVEKELDWKPETAPDQGIRNLMSWVRENKKMLNFLLGDSNDADRN